MKKVVHIIFIFFSLTACTDRNTQDTQGKVNPVKIDLPASINNPEVIRLSDIADSIAYIPLEQTEDLQIKKIFYSAYFPDDIFIGSGPETGLLHFNGKGRFLNKVGEVGHGNSHGSNDYLPGADFSIIDTPKRVFILNKFPPRNILELDYNGYFIDRFSVTNPSDGSFEAISADKFLFLASPSTISLEPATETYLGCIKDKYDNVKASVRHPLFSNPEFKNIEQYKYGGAMSGRYFEGFPVFFDVSAMDTIYSVNEKKISPKYIICRGEDPVPFDIKYSDIKASGYPYVFPIASSFVETRYNIHLLFLYNDYSFLATFHKGSGTISSMKAKFNQSDPDSTPPPLFENDIDGGISVIPGKPDRSGDLWTYVVPASYFKSKLTKDHFTKSKAKDPEKKAELIKTVDSITSGNPVIMVIYLKK